MSFLTVFKIIAPLLGLLGEANFSKEVIFKSNESKTKNGSDVFNKIRFQQKRNVDIWHMKQSHHGLKSSKWDTIEIQVNKNDSPPTVTYHQLKKNEEIEYSANCLRCHSGGPRLIRPANDSRLSIKEKVTLFYWNTVIKSYGQVKLKENRLPRKRMTLLKYPKTNKQVMHRKCVNCHNKNGVRSPITSFQKGTITHLIRAQKMPPWPYKINNEEMNEIFSAIYQVEKD